MIMFTIFRTLSTRACGKAQLKEQIGAMLVAFC